MTRAPVAEKTTAAGLTARRATLAVLATVTWRSARTAFTVLFQVRIDDGSVIITVVTRTAASGDDERVIIGIDHKGATTRTARTIRIIPFLTDEYFEHLAFGQVEVSA